MEASVPVTETGRSSARRKPFWMFVAEGVKIDLSFTVTSTALVVFLSNLVVLALLPSSGVETLTREVLVFGNRRTSLHFRSVSMLEFKFNQVRESLLTCTNIIFRVEETCARIKRGKGGATGNPRIELNWTFLR